MYSSIKQQQASKKNLCPHHTLLFAWRLSPNCLSWFLMGLLLPSRLAWRPPHSWLLSQPTHAHSYSRAEQISPDPSAFDMLIMMFPRRWGIRGSKGPGLSVVWKQGVFLLNLGLETLLLFISCKTRRWWGLGRTYGPFVAHSRNSASSRLK